MSNNLALRRREILDYADTIRILKEQGHDVRDYQTILAKMREKFNEDLMEGRLS
jgi:hypothetical protein